MDAMTPSLANRGMSDGRRCWACSIRKSPAPPRRAARKVLEPASGACFGSASRRAASPVPAGSWPGGPGARALWRSGDCGQRRPTPGPRAPLCPGSADNAPPRLRVPGRQPGAVQVAFCNEELTGGVRRRVRSLARRIRPLPQLLTARVRQRQGARTRVFLWPAEAA